MRREDPDNWRVGRGLGGGKEGYPDVHSISVSGYSDNPEQGKLSGSFVTKDTGQSETVWCSRACCLFWRVGLLGGGREKKNWKEEREGFVGKEGMALVRWGERNG